MISLVGLLVSIWFCAIFFIDWYLVKSLVNLVYPAPGLGSGGHLLWFIRWFQLLSSSFRFCLVIRVVGFWQKFWTSGETGQNMNQWKRLDEKLTRENDWIKEAGDFNEKKRQVKRLEKSWTRKGLDNPNLQETLLDTNL